MLRPTKVNDKPATPSKSDPYGQIKELLDRRQFLVPDEDDDDDSEDYDSDDWDD